MNYYILYTCSWLFISKITCTNSVMNQVKIQVNNDKLRINHETMEFMQKYGYLNQSGPQALITGDALVAALKLVQKFGGLEQTGQFDNDTLKLVKSKRCGILDIINDQKPKNTKSKRFTIASNGWNKRILTYHISNFTPKLSHDGITREIQRAFTKWSQYSQLNFLEVYNTNADIVISFDVFNHGDSYSFDGPGNVLAHAFYPSIPGPLAGDIHFDGDEDWTLNISGGVDLFSVAIHEIGHSLGLGHSSEPNSIMNPYYKNSPLQGIGYDDILGLHSLYITRILPSDHISTTINIQPRPNTPSNRNETVTNDCFSPDTTLKPETSTRKNYNIDECKGHFDAVSCIRGEIFVFKEKLLWRLKKPGSILPRYPVELLRFFQVLVDPDHKIIKIDAVYERPDSNIIIFHGSKYYVFNGNHLIENSPRSIMDYGFPPFVDRVDAAMVFGEEPLTYLFSGEYFWIYDDREKKLLQKHRSIKEQFKGVITPIDDVLTLKFGDTYFFNGNQFWKFNHNRNKTEVGYPKNAAEFLLGCKL